MRRRDFIKMIAGSAATQPFVAFAQPGNRLVGMLSGIGEAAMRPQLATFRETLSRLGWKDSKDVTIDVRLSDGDREKMLKDAASLVTLNPEVIVTQGSAALGAIRAINKTIPVVFTLVSDPVRLGFVDSLARPGGPTTGFTNFEISMGAKWIELLKELSGRLKRVTLIANANNPSTVEYSKFIEQAAQSISISVTTAGVSDAAGIEAAIIAIGAEPGGGLIIFPDFLPLVNRKLIIELSARMRLPAIYPFRIFPQDGGLISYGLDFLEIYRQAATYVDRILRGTKPADLPVQAPNKFDLVINIKTAKALGLTVPNSLLQRADELIE